MAYTIGRNDPEYFFLASYQMSPGVENKISTKNYFRGGQKIRFLKKIIKNHLFEILNLCNGLHYQHKPPRIFFLGFVSNVPRCRK